MEAFLALHFDRWETDGSALDEQATARSLRLASAQLGPERLRVYTGRVEGRIVAVQIFVRAGAKAVYWNGGWDRELADARPGAAVLHRGIEREIADGATTVELGPGSHEYKRRISTEAVDLETAVLTLKPPRGLPAIALLGCAAMGQVLTRMRPHQRRKTLATVDGGGAGGGG